MLFFFCFLKFSMQAEVSFLGDLIHPNLVKLIGYCIEDDPRLLVYEKIISLEVSDINFEILMCI